MLRYVVQYKDKGKTDVWFDLKSRDTLALAVYELQEEREKDEANGLLDFEYQIWDKLYNEYHKF